MGVKNMNRAQQIYLKRRVELDIDGEREKREEKQRKLAEEQKEIKKKLSKARDTKKKTTNVPDSIFKGKEPSDLPSGKGDDNDDVPTTTAKKRRSRKKAVENIELEGEEEE